MHQKISESAKRAAFLTPLTSIRFFAALHIFLFHLYNGHELHRLDPAASLHCAGRRPDRGRKRVPERRKPALLF